jgi:hypothetical protein
MRPFKITHPAHQGEPYEGPHIDQTLAKRLETHRWHVLRITFDDDPLPETYETVLAAKTVTPHAMKKLLAKAWCARQIMWHTRQCGILVEVGADGYYLVTPGGAQPNSANEPRRPGVGAVLPSRRAVHPAFVEHDITKAWDG